MPTFQGFFDDAENKYSKRFMLIVASANARSAKESFEAECPSTHHLTAVAELSGNEHIFHFGERFDSVAYSGYLRSQRDITPPGKFKDLYASEPARQKVEGAPEPDLDDIARRNPVSPIATLINIIGWLMLVGSLIIAYFLFSSGDTILKVFAASFLLSVVVGALLIALAWGLKVLNRIMVVTQYQAELARFRHVQEKIVEEKRVESLRLQPTMAALQGS